MRWLAVLVLGLVMYFGVPMLWQRAMVQRVNELSANQADIPVGNAIEINYEASANLVNPINPQLNIDTNEAQRLAVQSAADDAMRRSEAAQDQAWQATHQGMH